MRVVSMVPSWTEMLIEAGITVVGRTRFCIHPDEKVKSILAVGGTKDIDWEKVKSLNADLLILDRDENPAWMAEQSPIPWISTHVRSIENVARDISQINERLHSPVLENLIERWLTVEKKRARSRTWDEIPAVIEWRRPANAGVSKILYLIWENPWMAAGQGTFISSVFEKLGFTQSFHSFSKPYPEIDLKTFSPDETLLILSSEPFPFHRRKSSPEADQFAQVIVDGAAYSWFGLRSLLFLEKELGP